MTGHNPFRYFKTSPEIIRLAVMMYVSFPLSLRNVEDLLHERGIDICHEPVRYWWNKFGPLFAGEIREKRVSRPQNYSNWKWHLDEVFVKINGETYYIRRTIDHEDEVLEVYVSKRRDRKAAIIFLKKLMKRYGRPHQIVTDRLRSYRAAMKTIENAEIQEVGRWKNNRCENSHLPFQQRGQAMLQFRRRCCLQKFASIHASAHNHFNLERHLANREKFKLQRNAARAQWQQLSAV